MSMAPCRSCGREISTELVTCPHCHVPRPTQSLRPENTPEPPPAARVTPPPRRAVMAAAAVLVLVTAGVLARLLFSGQGAGVELAAHARYGNALVTLINADVVDWTDCVARINADVKGGGWERHFPRIAAGDSVRAPVRDFMKPKGERFVIRTDVMRTLSLVCSTPRGEGRWSAGFAP